MFGSLVLSMAAATKKERKEGAYPWKAGASSGHIRNLKQSILDFRYLCFDCSQENNFLARDQQRFSNLEIALEKLRTIYFFLV